MGNTHIRQPLSLLHFSAWGRVHSGDVFCFVRHSPVNNILVTDHKQKGFFMKAFNFCYLVVDTSVYSLPLGVFDSLADIARAFSLCYDTVYECYKRAGENKRYHFRIERVAL